MAVKIEEKHTFGGHELVDFKIDEKREYVKGKAGPSELWVDAEGTAYVLGKSEKTGKEWFGKYVSDRVWVRVPSDKWSWPFRIIDGKPHSPRLPLVDPALFEGAKGKGMVDEYLSLEGVRDALVLHGKGELRLAERGEKELEKSRLGNLKGIAEHEDETNEACQLFPEVERIRKHPEVLKLAREKGLIGEKSVMTKEKAQVLTAIDSIAKSGELVTAFAMLEWLQKKSGVEPGDSERGDIMKMTMLLAEVKLEGYVESTNKGMVLTNSGRKELEEYNNKKNNYVA